MSDAKTAISTIKASLAIQEGQAKVVYTKRIISVVNSVSADRCTGHVVSSRRGRRGESGG